MIPVSKGDTVLIRDVLKCREWFANVMAAIDNVIITADDARFIERFIERFDGEGWDASRTRRIISILTLCYKRMSCAGDA